MKRKNGRNHGEVFTKLNVVNYILDEVGYLSSKNLKNTLILEPASGQGSFAIEIINRLVESSINFHFDFNETCYVYGGYYAKMDDGLDDGLQYEHDTNNADIGMDLTFGMFNIDCNFLPCVLPINA